MTKVIFMIGRSFAICRGSRRQTDRRVERVYEWRDFSNRWKTLIQLRSQSFKASRRWTDKIEGVGPSSCLTTSLKVSDDSLAYSSDARPSAVTYACSTCGPSHLPAVSTEKTHETRPGATNTSVAARPARRRSSRPHRSR